MAQYPAVIDLSVLTGSGGANPGFRLDGIDENDFSGWSVASAGDVNGDSFDDVIIGAPGSDSGAGETYMVFGRASGFTASLDLSTLEGSNGFRLEGIDASDNSGVSVASAGDVNGDGFADLMEEAEDDVLTHMSFPKRHWPQLHSTNPLEQLNSPRCRELPRPSAGGKW